MSVYSLYVNNKHGTLIYQRNFSSAIKLTANDKIILASTFHGLSGIAAQLTPTQLLSSRSSSQLDFLKHRGITNIQAGSFALHCFHTLTGFKFFLVVSSTLSSQISEVQLRKTYELFCDYVLKDPFHDMDMPVRCEPFDREIRKLYADYVPAPQTIHHGDHTA